MATAPASVFLDHGLDQGFARNSRPLALPLVRTVARLHRHGLFLGARIADSGLLVDLGDSIGSGRWWRGLATLGVLTGAALSLGSTIPSIVAAVPPRITAAQLEEQRADAIAPLSASSRTGRSAPPTMLARRLSEVPERPRIELSATVGSGGLEGALRRAGVGRTDLDALRTLLTGVFNPTGLKPGTTLDLVMGRRESRADPRPLESLAFRAAFDLKLAVARRDGVLLLTKIPIPIDETPLRISGEVGGSLARSARAAGVPAAVLSDYLRQIGNVLDVQRDVKGGDRFDIIVAHRRAQTGETQVGQLLYAGLESSRRTVRLMRWGPKGQFFRENGEGAKKGLIRTPIDGARMSSGFGMRFHPILNYSRMHQGVDFAAGTGTPVLASAAGRVIKSGWGGGYGNVIQIDHGKGLVTRYAHLSRLVAKAGQQVAQGQVVGNVGTTGLSTGPHLHYEVWQNGRPVDPRSAKFQTGVQLGGADLARFKSDMGALRGLKSAG